MRIDMPLPTPRSVTSSPATMIRPVPAVIVSTMMRIVTTELSVRDLGAVRVAEELRSGSAQR